MALTGLASAGPSARPVALTGLVAHYPLDGTAEDVSGHRLNGVLHGTQPAEGAIGLALVFNGLADYVQIPSQAFTALPHGTFAFWMKRGASHRVPPNLWGIEVSDLGSDILYKETFDGLTISGLKLNTDGRLQVTHSNFGRNSRELERANDLTTSASLEVAKWAHVAWTWDGEVERIYLNGELNVSKASGGGVANVLGAWVRLGSGDTRYAGLLDDIWIFDRALAASEVLLLASREADY